MLWGDTTIDKKTALKQFIEVEKGHWFTLLDQREDRRVPNEIFDRCREKEYRNIAQPGDNVTIKNIYNQI